MTQEDIRRMKWNSNVVSGSVHPDTQKIIPHTMRLSGYTVIKIPIMFAVMFAQQSPAFNAFAQWVNQTYNAMINYGNRNASSKYTNTDIARGYVAAVTVSLSIVLFTRKGFAK